MQLQRDFLSFFTTMLFRKSYTSFLYDYFRSTIDELLGIINIWFSAASMKHPSAEQKSGSDDVLTTTRQGRDIGSVPVPHYRIALSPPKKKSPPADNLPAKIRPARVGRIFDGSLNCRPGETFYREGNILKRGDIVINSVTIFPLADFYGGDILVWHRHIIPSSKTATDIYSRPSV